MTVRVLVVLVLLNPVAVRAEQLVPSAAQSQYALIKLDGTGDHPMLSDATAVDVVDLQRATIAEAAAPALAAQSIDHLIAPPPHVFAVIAETRKLLLVIQDAGENCVSIFDVVCRISRLTVFALGGSVLGSTRHARSADRAGFVFFPRFAPVSVAVVPLFFRPRLFPGHFSLSESALQYSGDAK
jgi:hypothetical protein